MKIAILCPGPSLSRTYTGQAYDRIIGVNRVPTGYTCDVWAATDLPLVLDQREKIIGEPPPLLTNAATEESLLNRGIHWPGGIVTTDSLRSYCPDAFQWTLFTCTAALVYAGFIGATAVDAYGIDWDGTRDWDGADATGNRSPDRWRTERQIWNNVAAWMGERGVGVNRILP